MVRAVTAPAQTVAKSVTGSGVLMRALLFKPALWRAMAAKVLDKRYPARALSLHLVSLREPERRSGFERLKVRMAGICGTDLSLLYGRSSPVLSSLFSFPAVLGHEVLAELGGVRVVVNPLLTCLERGLPDCPACARGEDHLCHNIAEGNFAPGMLGYCTDLPGGWSERMLVHRERILPLPEDVPDERAVLAEPMAVALHGIRSAWSYDWPNEILVVGAGTIGLLAVRMLRVMGFGGAVHVLARYPKQAELAKALGANQVHRSVQEAQQAVRSKRYRGLLRSVSYRGGFEGVIEASGTGRGLQEASWSVGEGSKVLLLGAPGVALQDFSPYWFREVKLVGSYAYSWDDFAQTVKLLPEVGAVETLVTHSFALEAWPEAIRTAVGRNSIKVVFKP